jgi:Tol biopolymer transport system component
MKKGVIIGIIVGILIIGVVGFFLLRPSPGEEGNGQLSDSEPEETIQLSDITQITFLDNLAGDPSWSPDGSQIVFLGIEKNMMEGGLYIINSDGTGLFKIEGQWERDHLFNPSWNPINNKIICHGPGFGGGSGGEGLFLIDLDGDQTERIELSSQIVEHVGWNHDGEKIAYNVYNEDRSFSSVWVMNADGSGQTQLTTTEDGFCTGPSFNYDGSKIVYLKGFTTTLPGDKPENAINEIWVMNSDGSNKHMIYAPGGSMQLIRERAWNKDNKIIFMKHLRQRAPQIWIINSDGTNPKLIFDPEEEGIPTAIYDDAVWDNSGTKVAVTKVLVSDESWHIATFSLE